MLMRNRCQKHLALFPRYSRGWYASLGPPVVGVV